ncbi:MAG: hypothetical protein GX628_01750 [Clostridiales bacterium]|nr:hypothetical protein [Clostridiales bacterium]
MHGHIRKLRAAAGIMLLMVLAVFISACSTADGTDSKKRTADDDLTIIAHDGATDYVIVRPDVASPEVTSAAVALRKAIIDATGAEIGIKTDFESERTGDVRTEREILVGLTNRDESIGALDDMRLGDWLIRFETSRIEILAGSEGIADAVEAFIRLYIDPENRICAMAPGDIELHRAVYPADSIIINGSDIRSFAVIAPDSLAESASLISDSIADLCGYRIPTVTPHSASKYSAGIAISVDKSVSDDVYSVKADGSMIVISTSGLLFPPSEATVWFIDKYLHNVPSDGGVLSINVKDEEVKSMNDRIKIADAAFLAGIDTKAEALKAEILGSVSTVKPAEGCGAFYVSNSGSIAGDGKTPGTAWETLDQVNGAPLKPGDVVYFERGGVFRGNLKGQTGVTYSAYGEGPKPIINGSPENYSQPDKWKPTEYENLWVYDEVFERDCGLIVFNDGEAWSVKRIVGSLDFKGTFDELKNDLEMYHSLDDKRIYLVSTEGNPAERFDRIDFALKNNVITCGDNCTFDNIAVKYGGSHGIGTANRKGLTVRYCEFGWIGGSIQGINATTRFGNAVEIYVACEDFTVDHCYVYQIYDAGLTHQFKGDNGSPVPMVNVTYINNLIEYCTYSIEYFLDESLTPGKPADSKYSTDKQVMKNIVIRDNIMRFAGYGWGDQRPDKTAASHLKGWDHANPADGYIVVNNIFDRSRYMLVHCGAARTEELPTFSGNTFVQYVGSQFGRYSKNPTSLMMYDSAAAALDSFSADTFMFVKDAE